jgi:hypothetical protein
VAFWTGRKGDARPPADRGVPRAKRRNQVRIRNRIETRKPRGVSVFGLRFLPDLGEMGEIRNSEGFPKIPDEKHKPKFEIWTEKWPKFERKMAEI